MDKTAALRGVDPSVDPVYLRLQADPNVVVQDIDEDIAGAAYIAHWKLPKKVSPLLVQARNDALEPGVLKQRVFRMMGKEVPFPRLTALVAGKDEVMKKVKYGYSGGKDVASTASDAQLALLVYLNRVLGYDGHNAFNSFLLNYYHLGDQSSIGRHQDDETDLANGSLVAGVSWIENPEVNTWMFRLRSVQPLDVSGKKPKSKWVNIKLEHGQCFCMGGPLFQHRKFGWSHEIPKSTKRWPHKDTRLSFTARRLVAPKSPSKRKLDALK